MRERTKEEQKAYFDGFVYCHKQYKETLKRKSKEESIENMEVRVKCLREVIEREINE